MMTIFRKEEISIQNFQYMASPAIHIFLTIQIFLTFQDLNCHNILYSNATDLKLGSSITLFSALLFSLEQWNLA